MMEWSPEEGKSSYKVAFVSVGAMLVGSNRFTGADVGQTYERGTEMGYFAYGVSHTHRIITYKSQC
jgi:phosphatidylserine decarboxylase